MVQLQERGSPVVGERVVLANDPALAGTVRFTGKVPFAEGPLVGVELDAAAGSSDGSYEGKAYFSCPQSHGLFVRPELLTRELAGAASAARDAAAAGGAGLAADLATGEGGAGDRRERDLMQRYRSLQDAVAQVMESMAGFQSVLARGSDVPFESGPAKYVTPLERWLLGTWEHEGSGDTFRISEQVDERGRRLLHYSDAAEDCRFARRDGGWLVGEVCNISSQEVLGSLRVKPVLDATPAKVALCFRPAGATDWEMESTATMVPDRLEDESAASRRSSWLLGRRRSAAINDVRASVREGEGQPSSVDFGPVLQEIRLLARSREGAVAQSLEELLQAVNDVRASVSQRKGQASIVDLEPILQEVRSARSEAKQDLEAIRDGSINFEPVVREIDKYMSLLQDSVKNGANFGPIMDAMRKNQRVLLKKIEAPEAERRGKAPFRSSLAPDLGDHALLDQDLVRLMGVQESRAAAR